MQTNSNNKTFLKALLISTLLVLIVVIPAFFMVKEITVLRQQLKEQKQQIELVTTEYKKQLADNIKLQEERDAAKKAIGYTKQSDVDHNVTVLSEFFSFMGKSNSLKKRMDTVDFNNPEELDRYTKDLNDVLEKGLGTITRIMLHNTEPEPKKESK